MHNLVKANYNTYMIVNRKIKRLKSAYIRVMYVLKRQSDKILKIRIKVYVNKIRSNQIHGEEDPICYSSQGRVRWT